MKRFLFIITCFSLQYCLGMAQEKVVVDPQTKAIQFNHTNFEKVFIPTCENIRDFFARLDNQTGGPISIAWLILAESNRKHELFDVCINGNTLACQINRSTLVLRRRIINTVETHKNSRPSTTRRWRLSPYELFPTLAPLGYYEMCGNQYHHIDDIDPAKSLDELLAELAATIGTHEVLKIGHVYGSDKIADNVFMYHIPPYVSPETVAEPMWPLVVSVNYQVSGEQFSDRISCTKFLETATNQL